MFPSTSDFLKQGFKDRPPGLILIERKSIRIKVGMKSIKNSATVGGMKQNQSLIIKGRLKRNARNAKIAGGGYGDIRILQSKYAFTEDRATGIKYTGKVSTSCDLQRSFYRD
jgi:hypothetical protein